MIIPLKSDRTFDIKFSGWNSVNYGIVKIVAIGYLNFDYNTHTEVKNIKFSGSTWEGNSGRFFVPPNAAALYATIYISCNNNVNNRCGDHYNVLLGESPTRGRTWSY